MGVSKPVLTFIKAQAVDNFQRWVCEISEWSAGLLWNLLRGKGITRAVEGAIRAGHHPLTKFEVQKYYENGPKFNGFYSRNN